MKVSKEIIDRIVSQAKKYAAKRTIMFGGAVTDPETANDLDIILDGITGWELFEFAGKTEEELNISIDVVSLSPSSLYCFYKLVFCHSAAAGDVHLARAVHELILCARVE